MSFVVCGWFTPDYRHWWNRLRKNLDTIGAHHDFVERRKADGGWEINTQRKPAEILAAIERHPGKTIIFLDVDCAVTGRLDDLAELAAIPGDVALYHRTKWRRSGIVGGGPRTGTMVLRPTPKAREFVTQWCEASLQAPRYTVDQDSVKVALGRVPGLTVTYLDVRYCAVPADKCASPVILHDRASQKRPLRGMVRLFGRLAWASHYAATPITAQRSPTHSK